MTLVRLGLVATSDVILGDARRDGRELYDRMELSCDARVLVDHDDDRPIGRVLELFRMPDTRGTWWVARVELDSAPAWVRKGTPASFGYSPLHCTEINGWEIIRRGLVNLC